MIALGAVSDRTGRARPQLRALMRRLLVANLRREGNLAVRESLSVPGPPAEPAPNYVIDATIARLEHDHDAGARWSGRARCSW